MSQAQGNCPTVELSAFLDGALAAPRAAAVEGHLASCDACQAFARDEKTLRRSLLILACPDAEVLGSFLDGTLAEPARAAVQRHFQGCAACSDIAEWTRKAASLLDSGEIEAEPRVPRKRRGRPVVRKAPAPILRLVAPIATVAAVAAAAFLFLHTTAPVETDVATHDGVATHDLGTSPTPAPRPSPTPAPQASRPPAPRPSASSAPEIAPSETPAPEVSPEGPATPSPEPSSAPESSPTPAVSTPPGEVERPRASESPAPAESAPGVAIAFAGGELRVGPSREKAAKVLGSVTVSAKDVLLASGGAGRFQVGATDVLLAASSEAHLGTADGRTRLSLEKGETFADANGTDLELACHGAVARAGEPGTKLLLRAGPRGASLLCAEGRAVFACASSEVSLGAGEASEVENGSAPTRPHAGDARAATWVPDARADRALAQGLEYPRCWLAKPAVLALKAQLAPTVALRDRARALAAIEAARAADDRLAAVAELAGPEADAQIDAIVTAAAKDPQAAPAAALAALAHARARVREKATSAAVKAREKVLAKLPALKQAIEKASGDDLAKLAADLDVLAIAGPLGLSPARVQALADRAPADETQASLERPARTPLSGLSARELEDLLRPLDQALAKDASVPANQLPTATLLTIARSYAAAGADDEKRSLRLVAQLAAKGAKACAASPAAALETLEVLALRKAFPGTPSVIVLERGPSSVEVTFTVESSRHPKTVVLAGSWDGWREDKEPMTARANGTFCETLTLPRARHQYKLRLEVGKVWEPDARNPLTQGDNMGGLNSVLALD